MSAVSVDRYLAALPADTRATVDVLRSIVGAAHSALTERIKWNAPSFALGDIDRITLGVAPKGGVRVILHLGAKAKPTVGFHFDDPDGLAIWPAPDRGVLTFADAMAVEERRQALGKLFSRWLEIEP